MAGPPVSTSQRQWLLVVVGTAAFAGMLAFAHLLLVERSWRVDVNPQKRYVLSDLSQRVLEGLDKDISIAAFLRSDDPRNNDIEDLVRRVGLASKRVHAQVIDVNRNPALARQYGVDSYGSLVVECEGRRRDFGNPSEEVLIAAIVQVSRPTHHKVYFVTGHGERPLDEGESRQGYGTAKSALLTDHFEVETLRLFAEGEVPADAGVIVLAGPRKDLVTSELLKLDTYLQRGGSLFALLDPAPLPALSSLLQRFGIVASGEIVLDSENRLLAGDFLTVLATIHSPDHPVSNRLKADVLVSSAQAMLAQEPPPGGKSLEILDTGEASWRTPDLRVLRSGGEAAFVDQRDTHGPVPIAASALAFGPSGKVGKILAVGDADFASDAFLGYLGNRDFFLNSVNWLVGEESMIGARPPSKAPGEQQFFVSAEEGRRAFVLATIAEPSIVLLFGIAVYVYRRMNG